MTSSWFDFAAHHTLSVEGGYSDHNDDRGGKTMRGITERLARAHGYKGEMRNLSAAKAKQILKAEFWTPLRLDEIDSRYIAAEIFDTAVNSGPTQAVRIAQEALRWFRVPCRVDGRMGPATIGAINSLLPSKEKHLYAALNLRQGMRYVAIIEADASQSVFFSGWMRRLARFPEMVQ